MIQTNALTHEPELHYCKLPPNIKNCYVFVMDATVATGAAAIMAIRVLLVRASSRSTRVSQSHHSTSSILGSQRQHHSQKRRMLSRKTLPYDAFDCEFDFD